MIVKNCSHPVFNDLHVDDRNSTHYERGSDLGVEVDTIGIDYAIGEMRLDISLSVLMSGIVVCYVAVLYLVELMEKMEWT